ncbi:MAG: hypothetical protein A3G93_03510 [Nitrospinae bacterium RIFCSPLOWO2_12_FULL_45_22]|nr:MAG: hypothetical protein A3G93_03510 [Nitrospinae bacterium RIFCSPLOWO2_12_FULL_45_22]
MAHISIEKTEAHLIERARDRFKFSEADARAHIYRIKEGLEKQAPSDWRFTRSPVAKFLIWDEATDFRIIGRTYRNTGREFLEKLKQIDFSARGEAKASKKIITQLANEYLELIRTPDSDICHELKTIFSKGQEITELKHSYRLARIFLPHIIPIDARRIATRPNAILCRAQQLWVRQNELLDLTAKEKNEYLLFEQLTPKGIDKSTLRIYLHDPKGDIMLHDTIIGAPEPIYFTHHGLPSHLRTASYWSLPTYVDAEFLDLLYKKENFPTGMGQEEALILLRIEMIHSEVRRTLGLPYMEKGVIQQWSSR